MEEVFMGIMVMLPLVVIFLLYVRKRREISPSPQEEQDQVRPRETVIRHSNARRMRRRPTAGSTSSSASTRLEVNDAESDDEIPMGDNDPAQSSKKKGKKRLEREAQRQAEEAARESRQIKQDRYAEMRRRKDEEREAQERLMEEEVKARQIMEEEAAAVEFEKWKGDFSVDAEGTNEDEVKESQGMLSDFVDYIKKHKCVPLEDLATEFQLRTQDCINRITSLEKMGRLSGVMDDRGKYIYISLEEMKAVADYIRRQGRVSISHLASKSNQFIDLEPKTEPLLEGSTLDMVDVA